MMVRFYCILDDKKKYYEVKRKINIQRGTLLRENIRDLKNEFYAELECLVHGRTLYLDLKASGLCKNLNLLPNQE
jgi:hypothetical protein